MKFKFAFFLTLMLFILVSCNANKKIGEIEMSPEGDREHEHESGEWIMEGDGIHTERSRYQICSVCDAVFNETEQEDVTYRRLSGITDEHQDKYRPNYELGSCRHLKGSPVVVLFFVDDNESSWKRSEALTFLREHVLVGLDYLEKSAEKWGVELDFKVEVYATHLSGTQIKYEGKINPNLYDGGSTKDVLDKAGADIGLHDNWELYSYYKAKYPRDDIIFLNFVKKPGQSYTRHLISTGYLEYTEHCVIFADHYGDKPNTHKYGTRAATTAHELLHLFGAEDYYTPQDRLELANRYYPSDIMLWTDDRIKARTLGDCTAYCIGWTDAIPKICYNEKWWKE